MIAALSRFFRQKANWPILVVPALLLLWAQIGAQRLALTSFDSLSYVDSPYRGNSPYLKPLPETQPGHPIAQHVVRGVLEKHGA